MPNRTLLIEIGTEELPPKSLNKLRESFESLFTENLKATGISFGKIKSYATPRRLAITVASMSAKQPDQNSDRKGPAEAAAFDEQGNPTKALQGFMRGCGVDSPSQLDTISTEKGDYLVFRSVIAGKALPELLNEIISESLLKLPVERRMRWGKSRIEFVRPVQWITCLHGNEVVPITVLGLNAGRSSKGHRFMSDGDFDITDANSYVEACRAQHVIVDFDERKSLISKQIGDIANAEGAVLEHDDALLSEVTALVEWPVALTGKFDPAFLTVPPEVLISAMKEHQRYFHLRDSEGKLLPAFITVANIESKDSGAVVAGNERVIRPRLSDAVFFFEQDTKTSLAEKTDRLKHVVFQADLGSYLQKAERVSALSGFIAEQLNVDPETTSRAGLLCKADLVSDMVGEFPDLQGVMGSYYALHDKEPNDIAKAIEQHYRPTQSGGKLPETTTASCVALADKIDSLVGIFGINQPPTGSRDPFALRRQALGVIRICVENHLNLSLSECLKFAAARFERDFDIELVSEYIIERLTHYYAEQGITGDVVDAATCGSIDDMNLLEVDDVIRTLQTFRNSPMADSIVAANKRVANLLKKVDTTVLPVEFDLSLATDPQEAALYHSIGSVDLFDAKGAGEKLERLAILQAPVDEFFEHVLVMSDDPAIRDNRLALLNQLRQLFLQVADFSVLQ